MDDEQRAAIRRSNQERNLRCRKCGQMGLQERDGAEVGCGNAQPITKRPKREKL